jgi:hypothetical protein
MAIYRNYRARYLGARHQGGPAMFMTSNPNRCFGAAIGSSLAITLAILLAALAGASTHVSSFL